MIYCNAMWFVVVMQVTEASCIGRQLAEPR